MKVEKIRLDWENRFKGFMHTPNGDIILGEQNNGQQPYHLLFGALGSCFYATFLSIAQKMRLSFDSAIVEVEGTKRDDDVATLSLVNMTINIKNPSNKAGLEKCVALGARFCSIHETIKQVATIDINIKFS